MQFGEWVTSWAAPLDPWRQRVTSRQLPGLTLLRNRAGVGIDVGVWRVSSLAPRSSSEAGPLAEADQKGGCSSLRC